MSGSYTAKVKWSGGRGGVGSVSLPESGLTTPIAVPADLDGPGGGSNPEELLTAAIGACYSITLGIIAANRKVPIEDIETEAVGQVEKQSGGLKFTAVTIRATVTLSADATDDQMKLADELAHKADGYCLITNAVRGNVEVTVEPTIRRL